MTLKVAVTERDPGIFIISPAGSIDTNTSAILEKEVASALAAEPRVVIFDMGGVQYMSSAGVRVILKTKKSLSRPEDKMALVNLQPQIKKVFDIICALPPQEIFSSVEELDRYLSEIQRKEVEKQETR